MSLLEILIALAIMSVIGGYVFVDYAGATVVERLKAASRRLAGYSEMIRGLAVSRGVTCRLELDFDKSRYRYVLEPPRDEFGRHVDADDAENVLTEEEIQEWYDAFPWDDLPRDVYLSRVLISNREYFDKGVVTWPFWPDGSAATFVLHLKSSRGHVASVAFNGLTGTATAEPDVALGFSVAEAGDFSNIMGNHAPSSGKEADDGAKSKSKGGAEGRKDGR